MAGPTVYLQQQSAREMGATEDTHQGTERVPVLHMSSEAKW